MDSIARQHAQRRGRELQKQRQQSTSDKRLNNPLRIVILGKNDSETSRVGNLILKLDLHESEEPTAFEKHDVIPISGMVMDRQITVFNTLHLLKPNISNHQITQTVRECVNLSDPGPHAFILVLQYKDFTEEDMRRVKYVMKEFSEEAIKRTIVLTTTHMSFMKKYPTIDQLIKECGGGHVQLGERKSEWPSEIFKRVDNILMENEEHLTCELFHDVKGTSVDDDQSSSEEENKHFYHKDDGKPKERQEERTKANLRDHSPEGIRPNFSLNVSGEQKLNLVLCGGDGSLIVSVSKLLRGIKIKASHQRASSEVCVKKEEKIHGHQISLIELPVLSRLSEEEVMCQTLRCVSLCDPGVHVFIFIIPVGPLTDGDKTEMEKIQNIFYSRDHFMVLFTSELAIDRPVTDFVKSSKDSQRLISSCGGQHCVMGLKEPESLKQIPEILDYIENMKTEPYSLMTYMKAQENRARRETEEKYKEELKRMEDENKELKQKIQLEGAECSDYLKFLRIVLIGRTGSGKSATGNTILGRNEFVSQASMDSVTTDCKKGVGEVDGRSVAVVDTPGLFDTTLTNELAVEEIMKCVSLSSPGPHVFVIVLSVGRFTKEEADTVDLIKKIFGPKAAQFSIVLFTRGDELEDESIEDYVKRIKSAELKKLIRDCGNRFLAFNNRENQDKTQVIQLLNMIEELKNTNEGRYFTNSMFEEAEMSIKRRTDQILKEREREMQNQKEELQATYEREMKDIMKRLEEEKQRADEERKKMEIQFREKVEKLRKEFEEKEKTEQKVREIENQKQSEEEKQQRAEYYQKIEEMKREIEKQRSQYEKQQKEREEEDRKREQKYRQDQEKMKNEQEHIIAQLQMKQKEEIKKKEYEEKMRSKEEEEERKRWIIKIKEAENERKEIQEEIKKQQREWEDEKKRQMREREEEERKRKGKHEEQLREKREELEKTIKTFKRQTEIERQKIEEERQKQRNEREGKEREYEEKKTEMERHYERLERQRKDEWERRKRADDERREEEKKRWKKMIEDLKRDQEEEKKTRESEEKNRQEREEGAREEMKKKHEEEIKDVKKKYEDEARKQAEELNDFREKKEQELKEMLEDRQKQHEILEKLYQHLKEEKEKEIREQKNKKEKERQELLQEMEKLKNKKNCVVM